MIAQNNKRMTVTVPKDIFNMFSEYAHEYGCTVSQLITELMLEFIDIKGAKDASSD